MAWLAIIYVFVGGFGRGRHGLRLRSNHTRSCSGLSAGVRGPVMTVALSVYAISPFLAMRLPLKYLSSILLFPILRGLEAADLAGRAAADNGFGLRASPHP